MALRTRIFAILMRRVATEVEDADPRDFQAHRDERRKLQQSAVGRLIFGTADRGVSVEDTLLQLGDADLRVRIYRPLQTDGLLPGVINFHGGGWVQGNPEQSEWAMSRIAARTPAVVVSVAYRLAPENPFPAAPDDCFAATTWVHDNAGSIGVDADRLAVMGDSAGGNLAAVVALQARDAGGPPLRFQALIYPGVEMYDKWDSEIRNAEAPVLTSRNMRAFVRLYLGEHFGTEDSRASPIRATSHAGLPPALIQTAEHDPLLDNGAHYRDVLEADGVPVRYTEYAGAIHGYLSLPGAVPLAKDALEEIIESLQAALA